MTDGAIQLPRHELLNQLTAKLLARPAHKPTLVAIDGRSAAGKSTFGDELAACVNTHGRPVLRSSIDDFHPPGHKYRSRQRAYTPESYYAEGYEYATFRSYLLDPIRQESKKCRLAYWDSFNDVPVPEAWVDVPPKAVVIVDGCFLLQRDLRHYWDYVIWLQVDWETMVERAARRDVAWVGSVEVVVERYRTFWIPTHTLYETKDRPIDVADLVIDNDHPEAPIVQHRVRKLLE